MTAESTQTERQTRGVQLVDGQLLNEASIREAYDVLSYLSTYLVGKCLM